MFLAKRFYSPIEGGIQVLSEGMMVLQRFGGEWTIKVAAGCTFIKSWAPRGQGQRQHLSSMVLKVWSWNAQLCLVPIITAASSGIV